MGKGSIERWFLGANSGAGFYSLYENFAADEDDFLWVLKAGPGCGKSGFMKRIGLSAEQSALDVQYIHCAGDPDSIDGIYLPEFKTGWVDGTGPHSLDPLYFGATGAYIDLGAFCDISAVRGKYALLSQLTQRYKEHYSRAYSALRAAAAVSPKIAEAADIESAVRRAESAAAREFPKRKRDVSPGRVTRRFISCFSAGGSVFMAETLDALCERVYLLDNQYGLASPFIERLLDDATERGLDVIACPAPLDAGAYEALIVPALSLGFLAAGRDVEYSRKPYRHIRLDAMVDPAKIRAARPRLRSDAKIEAELLRSAQNAISAAKAVHDEIEAVYSPCVDFSGIVSTADRAFWQATDNK